MLCFLLSFFICWSRINNFFFYEVLLFLTQSREAGKTGWKGETERSWKRKHVQTVFVIPMKAVQCVGRSQTYLSLSYLSGGKKKHLLYVFFSEGMQDSKLDLIRAEKSKADEYWFRDYLQLLHIYKCEQWWIGNDLGRLCFFFCLFCFKSQKQLGLLNSTHISQWKSVWLIIG